MGEANDWFHAILLFLYEKPLDGNPYPVIESTGKINGFNMKDKTHINKLANVLATLVEKNYVKHTDSFNLMLTIDGHNYMLERSRNKRRDVLYGITFIISIATVMIAYFSYHNDREKSALRQELQEKKMLIESIQTTLSQKESPSYPHSTAIDSLKTRKISK